LNVKKKEVTKKRRVIDEGEVIDAIIDRFKDRDLGSDDMVTCCGIAEFGGWEESLPDTAYVYDEATDEEIEVGVATRLSRPSPALKAALSALWDDMQNGNQSGLTVTIDWKGGRWTIINKMLRATGWKELKRFTGRTGSKLILWFRDKPVKKAVTRAPSL
jgi:hypothetical protein